MFFLILLASLASAQEFLAPDFKQIHAFPNMISVGHSFRQGVGDVKQSDLNQASLGSALSRRDTSVTVASARYKSLHLEKSDLSAERHLADAQFGVIYAQDKGEGRTIGLSGFFGSSSDYLFYSHRELTTNVTGFYTLPRGENKKLTWFLNYSNNRSFMNHYPLPGIGYSAGSMNSVFFVLGVPFLTLKWKINDKWNYSLSYFAVTTVKTDIAYTLFGPFRAYALAEWVQHSFYLRDRLKDMERFFYDEQRLALGLKGPATRWMMADLEFGYGFQRKTYVGEGVFKNRSEETGLPEVYTIGAKATFIF